MTQGGIRPERRRQGRVPGGPGWRGILAIAFLCSGIPAAAELPTPGTILLNEIKVNPPGDDIPFEFIELIGHPGWVCTNLYLLVIEGDHNDGPGVLDLSIDLSGIPMGSNGFLIVVGEGHPYDIPAETTVIVHEALGPGGASLSNNPVSFLLAMSAVPLTEGEDLDPDETGSLDGVPDGFEIVDAVGWTGGNKNDIVYGGAQLSQPDGIPDAAGRFPGRTAPADASAWFNGELVAGGGEQLLYTEPSSDNFPMGTIMTPGGPNYLAPWIQSPRALSGVVGDPTNPGITLSVDMSDALAGAVAIKATSGNPDVVPDANLTVTRTGSDHTFSLSLDPIGVGYADIAIYAAGSQSTGIWRLAYAASRTERPGGTFLTGVSDGSAAVYVDENWMLVADDEDQVIRLYSRHASGAPIAAFDLEADLALTDYGDGVPREVDFEAATRAGDMVYWLGSHSHAEIGRLRPNRWRVVATRLTGAGSQAELAYVGHYEHLRDDLLAWDQNNRHGLGADYYGLAASAADGIIPKEPFGAGFNIEGLTMAPGIPDTAYLCFRAPLVPVSHRARALVVPVTNFSAMAVAGETPGQAAFGEPFELFLGGRGIRSIEGGPDGFLITAGPVDNRDAIAPHIYKLYTWSGLPLDPPREHSADLTLLNPEGIVELPPYPWTPTSQVQIISDNGRAIYYNDGIPAKLLPEPAFRKFRSDWIELGHIVDPQPAIRSFTYAGPNAEIGWFAQIGRFYQVQIRTHPTDPSWSTLSGDILADQPLMLHTTPPLPLPQSSLRILMINP